MLLLLVYYYYFLLIIESLFSFHRGGCSGDTMSLLSVVFLLSKAVISWGDHKIDF